MNGNRGGRRSSATIEYNTGRARELIQTDTRVRLRLMASDLGLFLGTVQYTVVITVQYHKVYAKGCLVHLQTITNRQELCLVSVSRNVTQDRKRAVCVKWSLVRRMNPPIHSMR